MPLLFPHEMRPAEQKGWWSATRTTLYWVGFFLCFIATAVTSYTAATLFVLSCLALPISSVNAVLAANLVSCLVLACAIAWAFGTRTAMPLRAALLLVAIFLGAFIAITSYATISFALNHQ